MAKPIIVIGSSNAEFIMKMDHLPLLGGTIADALFLQSFGGKGANQATAAARAGGQVVIVTCVGDDQYGQGIRAALRDEGVNVAYVQTAQDSASGINLVMVDTGGQSYRSAAPGANERLLPADIDALGDVLRQAAMVVLQSEIPPQTLRHGIDVAFHLGKKVILNLCAASLLEDAYLRYLYVLVVNENEAETLVGYSVNSVASAQRAARDLKVRGPLYVLVTLGGMGSVVVGPDVDASVPAFAAAAVDSSAARDVYCGSLAAALVEGRTMLEAARFASAAAAISVTRSAGQVSAPSRAEIEAFLSAG